MQGTEEGAGSQELETGVLGKAASALLTVESSSSFLPILQLSRPLKLNSTQEQNNECLCFCKQIIITCSISGIT